ncbi:MAG: hypothetical protein IJ607_10855 [Bacteroidaceae bacterium]|nr:hypothetical protein [Bacteroidaceae bacterium]
MNPDKPTSPFSSLLDKSRNLIDDIKRSYHDSPLFKTNSCYFCGKPIVGRYYTDLYDHSLCSTHPRRFCVSCSGFCDSGCIEVGGGKYLCSSCQNFHTTLKDAKEMIKMIRAHYEKIGLGVIERFHLEMVSVEEMHRMTSGDVLGLASSNGRRYYIHVLENLSHTAMVGILAHEILHIWQFQRRLNAPNRISEGFCDLGSYEIYSQIKTQHSEVKIQMLQEDPSPIYGDGYRIVKRYFDKAGWAGVIKKMEGYLSE